jgi:gamma-glutamylcyclotransferase (GGCT)/AIG2-like uncharacterized protein YtfP
MTGRLFVYGTLMPGQPRWHLLAPLTTPDRPERAEAAGHLYRTPYGWPAAVFDPATSSRLPGLVITLRNPARALLVLDEVEGTSAGLFRRRLITTTAGQCWAYHWPGQTSDFQEITKWPSS